LPPAPACTAHTDRLTTHLEAAADAAVAGTMRDDIRIPRQVRADGAKLGGTVNKAAPNETVAGKLLVARRAMRGTDRDGSDLDHFVQVLCRLEAGRHGFGAFDLLAVESAWIDSAGDAWSGGFVARLKDRRRIHVDGRAGRAHWSEEDSDIEAGLLNEGEHHPELGARYGWQRHAWDDATARRLNELLDRFDAPEGEP
jgi:hypothetical protein